MDAWGSWTRWFGQATVGTNTTLTRVPLVFATQPLGVRNVGYNIQIGDNVYANFGCVILDCNIVKIGDNVKFGPNVQIYTATHPIDVTERIAGQEMAYPIEIGDNVWIGGSCIILPGVKIGKNTTIGAGSVVTKDVLENVVAVGNPCRVIKEIKFSAQENYPAQQWQV